MVSIFENYENIINLFGSATVGVIFGAIDGICEWGFEGVIDHASDSDTIALLTKIRKKSK